MILNNVWTKQVGSSIPRKIQVSWFYFLPLSDSLPSKMHSELKVRNRGSTKVEQSDQQCLWVLFPGKPSPAKPRLLLLGLLCRSGCTCSLPGRAPWGGIAFPALVVMLGTLVSSGRKTGRRQGYLNCILATWVVSTAWKYKGNKRERWTSVMGQIAEISL